VPVGSAGGREAVPSTTAHPAASHSFPAVGTDALVRCGRREAGTHRTTTFTSLGPHGRHGRFAPLSLTGTSAGSSPAKRGRWRAAPEGADAHAPRSSETDGLQSGMAQRGTPPSTMLRMVPLPHKWGRIPCVDGAGCSAAREKRVRYLPQPRSPHLVPA